MIRANGMTARHSARGGWLGIMATVLLASRIAVAAGEGPFLRERLGRSRDSSAFPLTLQ